jgi:hypothetical protein
MSTRIPAQSLKFKGPEVRGVVGAHQDSDQFALISNPPFAGMNQSARLDDELQTDDPSLIRRGNGCCVRP